MINPSPLILKRYASLLIDFALGKGKGIKAGEIVYLQFDSPALLLALAVYQRILAKGAHPIVKQVNDQFAKLFFQQASNEQLDFFPKQYQKELVNTIDHRLYLLAAEDPFYLKGIEPEKLMRANKGKKLMRKWLFQKEDKGKLTWTLALYATPKQAKEAGLSLSEYWQQIEQACFLNQSNPIQKWQQVFDQIDLIRSKLNDLPIEKINIKAKHTDLWLTLGKSRQWLGGSGANIPSFEIFTSPDWRGTNGHIYFDLPLYRYGNLIEDIYLEFKNGKVVKARAGKNQKLLAQLIKQKNADKVGEFSLTDKRFSRINKFMAHTLYDENFAGRYGNTHIALGTSYHEAYTGKLKNLKAKNWQALGFNESPEHTDIIAKQDREVMVILKDKTEKVIYKHGQFNF